MRISLLLGRYPGAVQAVDNAPRATEYVRAYRELAAKATALSKGLQNLNPRVREQLEARLMETAHELEPTERCIADLARKLEELQRDWSSTERRNSGAPRKGALRMTVDGLRTVFEQHYRGSDQSGSRRGAVTKLSQRQASESQFVAIALKAAGINTANLSRLLREKPKR